MLWKVKYNKDTKACVHCNPLIDKCMTRDIYTSSIIYCKNILYPHNLVHVLKCHTYINEQFVSLICVIQVTNHLGPKRISFFSLASTLFSHWIIEFYLFPILYNFIINWIFHTWLHAYILVGSFCSTIIITIYMSHDLGITYFQSQDSVDHQLITATTASAQW